ncbi:MAG: D-aminoacyl-tRNA deacylase [Paludibacteraceae bacterium]|nr:D-aminoacyl-tRNA deacylase [Paludibacteraceae bacterium]
MRVLIQRVTHASVTIDGKVKSKIENGLLVFVGIEDRDKDEDIEWLAGKVINIRIFNDENDVMNKSVLDINGEILVISQFTLQALTKKGNRPSYIRASKADFAVPMYEKFCAKVTEMLGKDIGTGEFGANMKVELLNDGPTTIWIDSHNRE